MEKKLRPEHCLWGKCSIILLGAFMLSCFLSACYEPVEACLDPDASNFDVNADLSCPDDCCQYPSLKLTVSHKAGDSFLSFDSVYTTNLLNNIRIKDARFYLTEFKLISDNGTAVGVEKQLDLLVDNNGTDELITVEDNFQIISRAGSSYTFGEIRTSGEFKEIEFLVGVSAEVNHADPLSLQEAHPLGIQADSMHWNQQAGYIFNKISFQPDTSSVELRNIEIGSVARLVKVTLPYVESVRKGFDINISVEIDYLKWFKGIDFVANDEAIRQIIFENTTKAFTIIP